MQREARMSLNPTKCCQDPLTLLRIADKLLTPKFSLWLIQPFPLKESALGPHFSKLFCLMCGFEPWWGLHVNSDVAHCVLWHKIYNSYPRALKGSITKGLAPSVPFLLSKIKSIPPSDPTAGRLANDSWERAYVWEQY